MSGVTESFSFGLVGMKAGEYPGASSESDFELGRNIGNVAAALASVYSGSGGKPSTSLAPVGATGTIILKVPVATTIAPNAVLNAEKYSDLKEPKNVGDGLETTPAQRKRIMERNKQLNNGQMVSDGDGKPLNPPKKITKGEKADMRQAEVDHENPKSKGGSNSNKNLRLISKEENLKKSNKVEKK